MLRLLLPALVACVFSFACNAQSSGEYVSSANGTSTSTSLQLETGHDVDIDTSTVTIGIPDGSGGFVWMDPKDVTVKCISPDPGNDPKITFTTPVPAGAKVKFSWKSSADDAEFDPKKEKFGTDTMCGDA